MDFEQLTAAVIHDLKNQVQTVMSESDRLKQQLPSEHQSSVDALVRRTRGIQDEISQLITLYQMKTHSIFSSEEAWPASTLRIVAEQCGVQYPGIRIETSADENLSGFYNDFLLQMALACLVTNSAQAGAGVVCLHAEEEGRAIHFTVTDDGPGFPESVLAGERVSRRLGGTGLGLYFSELVAKHHKRGSREGHVNLSNPGEGGGEVTLTIP